MVTFKETAGGTWKGNNYGTLINANAMQKLQNKYH